MRNHRQIKREPLRLFCKTSMYCTLTLGVHPEKVSCVTTRSVQLRRAVAGRPLPWISMVWVTRVRFQSVAITLLQHPHRVQASHSPFCPVTTEGKTDWVWKQPCTPLPRLSGYNATPSCRFHEWCIIEYRGNCATSVLSKDKGGTWKWRELKFSRFYFRTVNRVPVLM